MRISIDTGGTFTDCVYIEDGEAKVLKVPSTPADPGEAIFHAVSLIAAGQPSEVRHGTTVGTNALLERKGARTAFVTTAGFEDTIAIGRQARPKLYDWFFTKQEPLAPQSMCFGINERVAADGTVLRKPDDAALAQLRNAVAQSGAESVAVSLLFSFANPVNEEAVFAALADLGLPISLSHRILPEFREYERGSTVLINAYLGPKMERYLGNLERGLREGGSSLQVMQSSGGIIPASTAAREPVRTVLSGPAGGVVGAMEVAKAAGFDRILTFDMGGTSTDVALVDLQAGVITSTESKIAGLPVAVPMLNIHTVGAGGGSLASFDRGGALKVGPESAGAMPGPICYGRGEQVTVTDANLLLGRLDADGFLGGAMKLDGERSRLFADRAKGRLPDVESFAEGIVRLADSHMEKALRQISIEQGHDPREFALLSFGGAGPLHACALARALRIPTVVVPLAPGALSAYGILVSDAVRDYSRTVMLRLGDHTLEAHFAALESTGQDELSAHGLTGQSLRTLDPRYAGQGYELQIPFEKDYASAFHKLHEKRYGYSDPNRPIEIVNVRVRTVAGEKIAEHKPSVARFTPTQEPKAVRGTQMYFEGLWHWGHVYDRKQLNAGSRLTGPAVVTEYSATTFLPPGCRLSVDSFLNMIIEVNG